MGILKKDFKFKLVKNLLTPEETELGKRYLLLKHTENIKDFDEIQNNNGDSFFLYDAFGEALMINLLPRMQRETGLKLFPTYSFSRVYSYNADLKKHKDRPSCEVSVTLMFGSDGTKWPIFMDGHECEMQPGDGVIYLGRELEHWREPFRGEWHAQTFVHYVDQDGPYTEWKFDKRSI